MDESSQLEEIFLVCDKLGITVRPAALGGEGGGLCRLRGQSVLFVDVNADVGTRLQRSIESLLDVPGLEQQYVRPELREVIDRARAQRR